MAHGILCTCKRCNPSFLDALFGPTPKGPFSNPKNTGSKTRNSGNWGSNQQYYGGKGRADGPGHGHYNPNNGFNRPPVSDFLGNRALRSSYGKSWPKNYPR